MWELRLIQWRSKWLHARIQNGMVVVQNGQQVVCSDSKKMIISRMRLRGVWRYLSHVINSNIVRQGRDSSCLWDCVRVAPFHTHYQLPPRFYDSIILRSLLNHYHSILIVNHLIAAMDSDFDSSDIEPPDAPPNPHAHCGNQTIEAMILTTMEDRGQSKIDTKMLTQNSGAPGTVVARST